MKNEVKKQDYCWRYRFQHCFINTLRFSLLPFNLLAHFATFAAITK